MDKYASDISYLTSLLVIGWIGVSIIFSSEELIGLLLLTGPLLGLIAVITGIVGYRTGIKKKKAVAGIVTGATLILASLAIFIKLLTWLEKMKGAFPID